MYKTKPTIVCVVGTRPEALKMAPLIQELEKSKLFDVKTLLTGQHRELLDQMLAEFDITIDEDFNLMKANQSLSEITAALMTKFDAYFQRTKPAMVVAQGDTTTTMCAAMASFYLRIPYAHVEAGLRTHNIYNPFPEELNRQIAGKIAKLHFAPTQEAKENLLREGIRENVFMVGNTIIDTLYHFADRIPSQESRGLKKILVTCHRRENFGVAMKNICAALRNIVIEHEDVEIIFPVHPNPNVVRVVHEELANCERISLREPMDYPTLVTVLKNCTLVLSDSGGLQEEGPALGKPVLVLRTETERPEGVDCGAARLVGVETDNITRHVRELLKNPEVYERMTSVGSPYGDGKACERIVKIMSRVLVAEAVGTADVVEEV